MNLAAEMARLPEPPNDSAPPHWTYWRHDLWQRAQEDDPRNFMRWPCIYHTMLQDHWPNSIAIEANLHLSAEIVAQMMELAMGDRQPRSSWHNLIHQAYHIIRWQAATGLRISDMKSIYEFGGGYGAMALVCNRLGFKGRYYIYDLPEFALLQRWYLGECGISNVEWLTPEYGVNNLDLIIACYSLSETDYRERNFFVTFQPANNYLFLYSNKFEQYDNTGYFQRDGNWLGKQWRHERIEHLPPESWYSWGW